MSWSRQPNHPVNRRLREVRKELEELDSEIQRLQSQVESAPPPQPAPPESTEPPPQPGVRSQHGLSSREMDFFEPQEKKFIRIEPGHEPNEYDDPASSSAVTHISPRVAPDQGKARLAFYVRPAVQTLKPLRYERRVARNRVIAWIVIVSLLVFLAVCLAIKSFTH